MKNFPQNYARLGGILYLFIIIAGIFGQVAVRSKIIVPNNAIETAQSILQFENLFRLGVGVELLMLIADVSLAMIFYVLLKPVNRNIALLASFFRLVMASISGVNLLNQFSALLLLQGSSFLSNVEPDTVNSFAYFFLKSHAYGYHFSLIFFSAHCVLMGYLLFKASFLPKIIGILFFAAAFSYFSNSFSSILAPEIAKMISPAILLPALVAELSFSLWLIFKGIDKGTWDVAYRKARKDA